MPGCFVLAAIFKLNVPQPGHFMQSTIATEARRLSDEELGRIPYTEFELTFYSQADKIKI